MSAALASFIAPSVVAAPLLYLFPLEAWPIILGLTFVIAAVGAALLAGVTPTRERDPAEVGGIWAFAGAAAAFAFTGPADSCLSPSPTTDVVIGAMAGGLVWPCFLGARRLTDRLFLGAAR